MNEIFLKKKKNICSRQIDFLIFLKRNKKIREFNSDIKLNNLVSNINEYIPGSVKLDY